MILRNLLSVSLLLLASVFYTSCKPASTEKNKAIDKKETTQTNETKKTQAFLLTQPFEFDPTNENKVTGDYVAQTKITVPQNLPTQHKWIMLEGPVLENDLVAYRFYADSRHRFDIFGKTVADLVMDTVSHEYHDIMNWGSDILLVGNSLGLGSSAIWYQDSIYTLSDCEEKTIEIIENGHNKSSIRTTFRNLNIEGNHFDLVQDWSINAGQPWTEIHLKVLNGTLPDGMHFATGFVKHLRAIMQSETDDYFYAMNWGKQTAHKEKMGMAVLAEKKYQPESIFSKLNYAYAFKKADQEVRYRFLAVWEKGNNDVQDIFGFEKIVEQAGI